MKNTPFGYEIEDINEFFGGGVDNDVFASLTEEFNKKHADDDCQCGCCKSAETWNKIGHQIVGTEEY